METSAAEVMRRALLLTTIVGAAACTRAPNGDIALAKRTLDKAHAAGADRYAVDALNAANKAQADLDAELALQQARWVKSYDRASELAVEVQAAADKAAMEATANRAAALAAASGASPSASDAEGTNLFHNGEFANQLEGWTVHPESDATVSVDTIDGERAWHAVYRKGNWAVISQTQSLQPDTVYVYEATIKSTAPVVALYWQSDIGRFLEIDKTYPDWTHLRNVFLTPHWTGQPYPTSFHPVLMKGPGDVWLKHVRLNVSTAR